MSPQWKRIILLTLSTVALQGVFAALWRSSPSERLHASVPLLALLYFLLWQRHWPKVRCIYIVSMALGVLLFVWLLLGAQAHSLGGRVAWSEPFVWLYFLASLIVLYLVLRAGLMRLLEIIPVVKAWRAGAQSWLLHCLVSVGALAVFLPYLITTFDVHRFKVANATNPGEACGLPYEEVKFRAEGDGLLLSGWFIPR